MDDAALLHAWRDGDTSAGERLFEHHYDRVVAFFTSKVGDEADDLAQMTFMACVKGRDRIKNERGFRSYLFGVAYNVLQRHFRDKHRVPEDQVASRSVCDMSPGLATRAQHNEQKQLLLHALRQLPLVLQVVLELTFWEQMTSAEIGRALDLPEGTVRSHRSRARKLLEEALRRAPAEAPVVEQTIESLDGWAQEVRDRVDDVG